jgi:peptide/nickel transport system permease protein
MALEQEEAQPYLGEIVPATLAGKARRSVGTVLRYHKPAVIGFTMVVAIFLLAVLAPVLPVAGPDDQDTSNVLKPPLTSGHVLGVDSLGRDVLSRLIWGSRSSLIIAVVPVLLATMVGLILGSMAGFMGRAVEISVMRILDVFFGLPAVLLAVLVGVTLGPGLWNMIWAITIVLVPPISRVSYQAVVIVRELNYIEAARAMGARNRQIIIHHIVPNILAPVMAYSASLAGLIVVFGAGLSLIGLGVQGTTADWGKMIGEGRTLIIVAPHVSTIPGLGIFWVAIGFNLMSDAMRDALDPRLRA